MSEKIVIAKSEGNDLYILASLANRHGLITGATGTGKTVTLQKIAENFSQIGVPIFLADVKGDLTGLGEKGVLSDLLVIMLKNLPRNMAILVPHQSVQYNEDYYLLNSKVPNSS